MAAPYRPPHRPLPRPGTLPHTGSQSPLYSCHCCRLLALRYFLPLLAPCASRRPSPSAPTPAVAKPARRWPPLPCARRSPVAPCRRLLQLRPPARSPRSLLRRPARTRPSPCDAYLPAPPPLPPHHAACDPRGHLRCPVLALRRAGALAHPPSTVTVRAGARARPRDARRPLGPLGV